MMKIINHKTAKALGLKRYFTGKPCKNGHIAERLIHGECVECHPPRMRAKYKVLRQSIIATAVAWNRAHPEKRAAIALKRGNGSRYEANVAALYEIQGGRCAACGKGLKEKYHLDHIVPLCLGGSNDRSNLQLLHPECNCKKGKKDPLVFYRELGFLL